MSLTLKVEVSDAATTSLGPLLASLEHRERINQEAATAVANVIRDRLTGFELGGDRHKSAGALDTEPSGFWARMAGGVSGSATGGRGAGDDAARDGAPVLRRHGAGPRAASSS